LLNGYKMVASACLSFKIYANLFNNITILLFMHLKIESAKIIIAVLSLDANELNVTLFLFMTINFHHYIVDSVIWKRR